MHHDQVRSEIIIVTTYPLPVIQVVIKPMTSSNPAIDWQYINSVDFPLMHFLKFPVERQAVHLIPI